MHLYIQCFFFKTRIPTVPIVISHMALNYQRPSARGSSTIQRVYDCMSTREQKTIAREEWFNWGESHLLQVNSETGTNARPIKQVQLHHTPLINMLAWPFMNGNNKIQVVTIWLVNSTWKTAKQLFKLNHQAHGWYAVSLQIYIKIKCNTLAESLFYCSINQCKQQNCLTSTIPTITILHEKH